MLFLYIKPFEKLQVSDSIGKERTVFIPALQQQEKQKLNLPKWLTVLILITKLTLQGKLIPEIWQDRHIQNCELNFLKQKPVVSM